MEAHSTRSYGGRAVRVHLPPGYDPERRDKYPLLLMHDGQNVFAGCEGAPEAEEFRPAQPWGADEIVTRLVTAREIPPVVVAAIDHAGKRRIAECTPTQGGRPEAGRAREYARLVFNEILPGLTHDFHIRTDAAGLTMCGSSMGGLITLWLAANHPGRFGRLIVMSPSVWWDDRVILRQLKTRPLEPPPRVWLDCGKREGPAVLRDTRALRDALRSNAHLHLRYVEDEDGDHSEAAWGSRLPEALAWIYGAELPLSARLRPRTEPVEAPGRRLVRRGDR
jgi:enterochelin esterase-like enzyme